MQPNFFIKSEFTQPSVCYTVDYLSSLMRVRQEHSLLGQKYQLLQDQNEKIKRDINALRLRLQKQKQKKRFRRSTKDLDKDYECPHENCTSRYASELALNLHIKNKHDGVGYRSKRSKEIGSQPNLPMLSITDLPENEGLIKYQYTKKQ